VDEQSIADMQMFVRRMEAGCVSPTSAAALAAVLELRNRGELGHDAEVVVFDRGIGQKYPPPPGLPTPPTVDPDDFDPESLIDQRGREVEMIVGQTDLAITGPPPPPDCAPYSTFFAGYSGSVSSSVTTAVPKEVPWLSIKRRSEA
jgi:hypothetical protein